MVSRMRRGSVLVAVLVVLVIAELALVGVVVRSGRDAALIVRSAEATRALYGAEAGLALAARELALGLDEDGDGSIGGVSDNSQDDDDPSIGGALVVVRRVDGPEGTTLVAVGRLGQARREISARAEVAGP